MTRLAALALTLALFTVAVVATLASRGHDLTRGHAIGLLLVSGIYTFGLLFERWRYKALERAAPGRTFAATGERFIDPETGEPVRVWYDADSGERRYIVDED